MPQFQIQTFLVQTIYLIIGLFLFIFLSTKVILTDVYKAIEVRKYVTVSCGDVNLGRIDKRIISSCVLSAAAKVSNGTPRFQITNIGAGFRTFTSRVGAGIGIGLIFSGLGVQDNLYTFCEAASKESAKAADYSGFVLFVSGIAAVLLMQNPQLLESLIDKYFRAKSESVSSSVVEPTKSTDAVVQQLDRAVDQFIPIENLQSPGYYLDAAARAVYDARHAQPGNADLKILCEAFLESVNDFAQAIVDNPNAVPIDYLEHYDEIVTFLGGVPCN